MVSNKKKFSIIKKCRICFKNNLTQLLDLGSQEPANNLKKNKKKTIPIPLVLMFCNSCKTLQLNSTVDPKFLFSNYLWVTGTSDKIKKYRDFFIKNIMRKYSSKKNVLEIASNDGFFLEGLMKKKFNVLGIDPAKNISKLANDKGIPTINDFFNFNISKKVKKIFKPDIILCRNVIPHVEDIHSVIKGIANLLDHKSDVLIEFHYASNILNKLHYDYIYHEHIFYFTLKTIINLLKIYNLKVNDCFNSPISGGSLVIVASKKNKKKSVKLKKLINLEEKQKINLVSSWKSFAKNCYSHRENLKKIIFKIKKNKNKIYGYGASARSSTILNFCEFNEKHISKILDKNKLKSKLYTAGSKIKIIMPSKKETRRIRFILLLAWNFKREIVRFLKKDLRFKGHLINLLPKIKIEKCK